MQYGKTSKTVDLDEARRMLFEVTGKSIEPDHDCGFKNIDVRGGPNKGKYSYILTSSDKILGRYYGHIHNKKTDERITFSSENYVPRKLTDQEIRLNEAKRAKRKKASEAQEAKNRSKLNLRIKEYQKAKTATSGSHPYIDKKGIIPCGDVRVSNELLLIPRVSLDGNIKNIQRIYKDGTKKYEACPTKETIFTIPPKKDGPTFIVEGYATGCDVSRITDGNEVIVAFDANGLGFASKAMRELGKEVVIVADNDIHEDPAKRNTGLEAARKCAIDGERVIVPPTETKADWNDYVISHGIDRSRTEFNKQMNSKESIIKKDTESKHIKKLSTKRIQRHSDYTPFKADFSLSDARENLSKVYNDLDYDYLVKAETGVGKTYSGLKAIKNHVEHGAKVLWVSSRYGALNEAYQKAKEMEINVIFLPQPHKEDSSEWRFSCHRIDERNKMSELGISTSNVCSDCEKRKECPLIKAKNQVDQHIEARIEASKSRSGYDAEGVLIIAHASYLKSKRYRDHSWIYIDEECLNIINGVGEFREESIFSLKRFYEDVLNNEDKRIGDNTREAAYRHLGRLDTLIKKEKPSEYRYQCFKINDNLDDDEYLKEIERLGDEEKDWFNGEANLAKLNQAWVLKKPDIYSSMRGLVTAKDWMFSFDKTMFRSPIDLSKAKRVVYMDATGNKKDIDAVYKECGRKSPLEVHIKHPDTAKIQQIIGLDRTKTHVKNNEDLEYSRLSYAMNRIMLNDQRSKGVLATHSKWSKSLAENTPRIKSLDEKGFYFYGQTTGHNFVGQEIGEDKENGALFVVGTPNPNPEAVRFRGWLRGLGDELPFFDAENLKKVTTKTHTFLSSHYVNDKWDSVRRDIIQEQIKQVAGRGAYRGVPTYIFSNQPIEGDEIEVGEMNELFPKILDFRDKASKKITRMEAYVQSVIDGKEELPESKAEAIRKGMGELATKKDLEGKLGDEYLNLIKTIFTRSLDKEVGEKESQNQLENVPPVSPNKIILGEVGGRIVSKTRRLDFPSPQPKTSSDYPPDLVEIDLPMDLNKHWMPQLD